MTSRERVRKALRHQEPDRVPLDVGGGASTSIVYDGYLALAKHLKLDYQTPVQFQSLFLQITALDEKVMAALGSDCRPLLARPPKQARGGLRPDGAIVDEWGVVWYKPESSLYYEVIESPLADATLETLERYPWPDPDDPGRTEGLAAEARYKYENTEYAIMANPGAIDIWQRAYALRGYEQLLVDLMLDKEFVHALFRKILDFDKRVFRNFLAETGKYIDVIRTADDLASAGSLLMSPAIYREMLKPYHKELCDFIKAHTDAKIFYHSCGSVYPLINDLIEVGVDILNPVQVSAKNMDTARLKEEFGARLCFWGGIDTTRVLPLGTVADVAAEVETRIKDLAPGGGFVLAAVHNIQPDVPPGNILAMCETARKYGTYVQK